MFLVRLNVDAGRALGQVSLRCTWWKQHERNTLEQKSNSRVRFQIHFRKNHQWVLFQHIFNIFMIFCNSILGIFLFPHDRFIPDLHGCVWSPCGRSAFPNPTTARIAGMACSHRLWAFRFPKLRNRRRINWDQQVARKNRMVFPPCESSLKLKGLWVIWFRKYTCFTSIYLLGSFIWFFPTSLCGVLVFGSVPPASSASSSASAASSQLCHKPTSFVFSFLPHLPKPRDFDAGHVHNLVNPHMIWEIFAEAGHHPLRSGHMSFLFPSICLLLSKSKLFTADLSVWNWLAAVCEAGQPGLRKLLHTTMRFLCGQPYIKGAQERWP